MDFSIAIKYSLSKDAILIELQSHIVYKVSCDNYNVSYCGKTERHLNLRSSEHLGISYLTGKRIECKSSAVSPFAA